MRIACDFIFDGITADDVAKCMNLRPLLLAFSLACLATLPSCIAYRGVGASASPAPGTHVSWPNVAFTEVRGYCYDYTAESDFSFLINGRMHQGVMNPKGAKLSPAQTKRLLEALTVSRPKQERTACYKPHHAFLFFNAKGQVVASFEMCFGCNKFTATPGGVPEYIGYSELYQLCKELGLPLGKGNKFYTDACRQKR